MQISSDMVMTVAFICVKHSNGTLSPRGTAFFVGHLDRKSGHLRLYIVTAKHVLDGIRERTGVLDVFVTYNGSDRLEEKRIRLSDWIYHPESSDAKYVDVAVARFDYEIKTVGEPHLPIPQPIRCWMTESIITLTSAPQTSIKTGLEVGITGLFVHHYGSERNIPIVRIGNIAAMFEEPVKTKRGLMPALLIEVRSVGGLSGSPVFTTLGDGTTWLLGLIHGHFDQRSSDMDDLAEDIGDRILGEKINAGIAIVVPADRIRETLYPLIAQDFQASHT
jgi:hypothetical protein